MESFIIKKITDDKCFPIKINLWRI